MDHRRLSDADLADLCKNVAAQLTAHSLKALDTDLSTDLAAMLSPLITPYETAIEEAFRHTAEKASKTATKAELRSEVIQKLSTVRNYLVAANASKSDYDLCVYNYQRPASMVIANAPSELSAFGTSNGVNTLRFRGNNRSGSVVYEIWRLAGDTEPFRLIASIKRQTFTDSPVTPGQVYNYKVRALASTNASSFSNTAVVYGIG